MTEEDYRNLSSVGLAHTVIDVNGLNYPVDIQVDVDLENNAINKYLDGTLVDTTTYQSLDDLVQFELKNLNFSDLIYLEDTVLNKYKDSLDLDKDNDGVIDRYDSDEKDSNVRTIGELSDREKSKSQVTSEKPSLLAQVRANHEKLENTRKNNEHEKKKAVNERM